MEDYKQMEEGHAIKIAEAIKLLQEVLPQEKKEAEMNDRTSLRDEIAGSLTK